MSNVITHSDIMRNVAAYQLDTRMRLTITTCENPIDTFIVDRLHLFCRKLDSDFTTLYSCRIKTNDDLWTTYPGKFKRQCRVYCTTDNENRQMERLCVVCINAYDFTELPSNDSNIIPLCLDPRSVQGDKICTYEYVLDYKQRAFVIEVLPLSDRFVGGDCMPRDVSLLTYNRLKTYSDKLLLLQHQKEVNAVKDYTVTPHEEPVDLDEC